MPSAAAWVSRVEEEQHDICITPAGAVTEVRIGMVTPEDTVPSSSCTLSRSTSALAASTPTLGSDWSSRSTGSILQPSMPPASFIMSATHRAVAAMGLPQSIEVG